MPQRGTVTFVLITTHMAKTIGITRKAMTLFSNELTHAKTDKEYKDINRKTDGRL